MASDPEYFSRNRRKIGFWLTLAGIALAVFAGYQLRGWTWPTTQATLTQCRQHPQSTGGNNDNGGRQRCRATWTLDNGRTYTADIAFKGHDSLEGKSREISVKGDEAMALDLKGEMVAAGGIGAVFVVIGLVMLVGPRRRP